MRSNPPLREENDPVIEKQICSDSFERLTGQRIVFTSPGAVKLEEFSLRRPGPHEVLVQTSVSIISPGTERAFLFAEPNTSTFDAGFPFYPGYSSIGRVLQVGEAVTGVRTGQLLGLMTAHQSHVVVRPPLDSPQQRNVGGLFDNTELTDMSWHLPQEMDSDLLQQSASFIIATVGLYGVARAAIRFGDEVIISGLGPVGLFAGQFAKLSGALSVIGIAQTSSRRDAAANTGFDHVYETLDECRRVRSDLRPFARTVVIEVTGRPDNVLAALEFCPPGATLVLLGCSRGSVHEVDFYSLIHRKALLVIGAHQPTRPEGDYLHRRWNLYWDADTALNMILKRRVHARDVISHKFAILQVKEAYSAMLNSSDAQGIALLWDNF